MQHIQLRGRNGEVVATDGRQLLVQSGFQLGWQEELLVPASPVFASRELAGVEELQLGKSDTHVVLGIGPWTLYLPFDQQSRFPRVEEVIPSSRKISSRCRLAPEDAAFLARSLPHLPDGEDDDAPVTLDLNGQAVIRSLRLKAFR